MSRPNAEPIERQLQTSLGGFQFLTIGLGTTLGIAWAIVLGNWLSRAAPLGTVVGFVIGGAGMMLIAACYAELATAMPRAGGDVVYALELFGRRAGFAVGWFLLLMSITATSFEAISVAWLLETLFPALAQGPRLSIAAHPIDLHASMIEILGMLCITAVHYRGARSAARLQDGFTTVKVIGALLFIGAAITGGHLANLDPPFTPTSGGSLVWGTLWIAATAPFWFGGFQVIPQAVEERRATTSLRTIAHMTVATVAIGILFYASIVLSAASTLPWRELVQKPLPALAAVDTALGGSFLAKAVLAAVALGIVATWNSCFLWATHLLLGMARCGVLPGVFTRINRFGAPGTATLFTSAVGLAALTLGREGLVPILNMGSISLALSFAVCCSAALRLRRNRPDLPRPYKVPGGRRTMTAAAAISAVMALTVLLEPLTHSRGVPLEWILMAGWGLAGVVVYRWATPKGAPKALGSARS